MPCHAVCMEAAMRGAGERFRGAAGGQARIPWIEFGGPLAHSNCFWSAVSSQLFNPPPRACTASKRFRDGYSFQNAYFLTYRGLAIASRVAYSTQACRLEGNLAEADPQDVAPGDHGGEAGQQRIPGDVSAPLPQAKTMGPGVSMAGTLALKQFREPHRDTVPVSISGTRFG